MLPFPSIIKLTDQLTRDDLRALSDSWSSWLIFSSLLVGIGVLLEAPEAIHTLIELCKNRKFPRRKQKEPSARVKVFEIIGWFLILIGVAGEGISELYVRKAEGLIQSFNNIVLEADEMDILLANQRAGEASANADKAHSLVMDAERRVAGVNQRAKEIDLELTYMERIISARRVQDVEGLTRDLSKKYNGRQVLLVSYTGDWDGYSLCSQLVDISTKAGMHPQNACGNEVLKGFPLTDIDVRAPTIPEAQDLSMVLMHEKRVPGMQVNLHEDPILTVRVGVKAPPPILWPPHKRSPDPKAPANTIKKKH